MKTLIVYASTYGYTASCAEQLRGQAGEDAHAVNIGKEKVRDISQYDTILIGGSIYMGQMQKSVKDFCEKNLPQLLQKNVGLFVCCGSADRFEEVLHTAFSEELLKHAKATACFGGVLEIEKLNFMHRTIAKMVSGAAKKGNNGPQMPDPKPLPQNVTAFAAAMMG